MTSTKKTENNPMMRVLKKPKNMGVSLVSSDSKSEIKFLDPNLIMPYKKQARVVFNDASINELAESIKSQGIIQPLQVIPSESDLGKYEVVSGERRLRAALLLKLDKVPCIILDRKKDSELVSIIENVQRQNLNPLELANAFVDLTKQSRHGQKAEIAQKIGVSPSYLSQHLSIAKLPEDVRNHLIKKDNISLKYLLELTKLNENEIREKVFNKDKKSIFRSLLKVSYNGDEFKFDLMNKNKFDQEDIEKLKANLKKFSENLEL